MTMPRTTLALCVLIAGCQTARMPLPESLTEQWPVQGRQGWKIQESISFGPYAAVDMDRSWTRGRDRDIPVYEGNERQQHYAFTLTDDGSAAWLVKCRTALARHAITTPAVDVELRNRSRLDCALTEAEGKRTWQLTMKEDREEPLAGSLHTDDDAFTVRGTTALEGGLPSAETSGYHLTHGSRPVAAVEVVNKGSVALDPTLSPETRSLLSAAAAALLLLDELRGSLDV